MWNSHLANLQFSTLKIHGNMKLEGPIIVQNWCTFSYFKIGPFYFFFPLVLFLKCWQNHIVDIRTAAFSRGQEKAGINHIGKNQKPGPDATNQFQIHQGKLLPLSLGLVDLTKFWFLLILVIVNKNSNCKWHLCARTCAAIRVRTVAGKMWERVCAWNPLFFYLN